MSARSAIGSVLALALLSYSGGSRAQTADSLDSVFERDIAIIVASAHACYRFDIYLALNETQQRRGLMFVRDLPQTTGMLFVYGRDAIRSMWMKNTFIPLDIAFMRKDGSIINITYSTEPQSLNSIRSTEPARYVLELNAGVADRFSIDAESLVLWGPVYGGN